MTQALEVAATPLALESAPGSVAWRHDEGAANRKSFVNRSPEIIKWTALNPVANTEAKTYSKR